MKKYILASLLLIASSAKAEDQTQIDKNVYTKDTAALAAFFVVNNEEAFKDTQLIALGKKYKDPRKIKKLLLTLAAYKKPEHAYAELIKNDKECQEIARLCFKSIGQSPENETMIDQIQAAPSDTVEEVIKGLIDGAHLTPEEVKSLSEHFSQLDQRLTPEKPQPKPVA